MTTHPPLRPIEIEGRIRRSQAPLRNLNGRAEPDSPGGRVVTQLAPKLGKGLTVLIVGPRGTGKTQVGVELIRAAAAPPGTREPSYRRAMHLFMERRDAMRSGGSELAILKAHASASLLVIDEVHDRGETRAEDVMLHQLVIARHDEMLDTVLIGNGTPEDMLTALGDSIASRMTQAGGVIVLDGPSHRGRP